MTTQTQQTQPVQVIKTGTTYQGVLAAALGCILAGAGAGILAGVACAIARVSIAPFAAVVMATWGVVAGLMMLWTFTAEPRDWESLAGECDDLEDENVALRDANAKLTTDNDFYQTLLRMRAQTITVTERGKTRTIPLVDRDATWEHAMQLVVQTPVDFGQLPGRNQVPWSQVDQAAAVDLLSRQGLAMQHGTLWRLAFSRQRSVDVLNAIVGGEPVDPSPAPTGGTPD